MPNSQPIVEACALGVRFSDSHIFKNLSLSVGAGTAVAITGRSGEGKSTLLYALAGLLEECEGEIRINRVDPYAMSPNQATSFRLHNLGFVFQTADLVPELSLQENVALPSMLGGQKRKFAMKLALKLLEDVGIDSTTARRRPNLVSGGQQQRAAIARAISTNPKVVFADEPTGALDSERTKEVLSLLLSQVRRRGTTLLIVTHDQGVASAMDRQLELKEGALHEC